MVFARQVLCLLSFFFTVSFSQRSLDNFLSIADDALAAGETKQAIELYKQGIHYWNTVVKDDDDRDYSLITVLSLFTNAGSSFSALEDNLTAMEMYRAGLDLYRAEIGEIVDKATADDSTAISAQAAFYLGMVYQDMDEKTREALAAYKYAASLDPRHWAAFANAASVYHDTLQQHDAALELYNQAYTVLTDTEFPPTDQPEDPGPILSQLQYRIGLCISSVAQRDEHDAGDDKANKRKTACVVDGVSQDCNALATHAFSLAVQYDRGNAAAQHMLATLTADATMSRASNTYVTQLFDDYAANFEHSLVNDLGYTGYERLRRGFDRAVSTSNLFDLVVDAGCGTGLVGEQFRNVSRTLIGVDLSAAIIEQAKERRPGLYDETIVGDIETVFRDRRPISLIIAADSYIYFGNLEPLFTSMRDGLGNGGYAAFTLENAPDETLLDSSKPDWRWQLTASGRFAHRKSYVIETAKANEMQLVHYEPLKDFRYEHGVGVQGHLFVVQKVGEGRSSDEL